jgi:hypothetical protein
VALIHQWTDQIAFTANLGYEVDDFSETAAVNGETVKRSDTLKNFAVGLSYRAVEWIGASFQYVFEDRSSAISTFAYRANTFTVALEAVF